MNSLYGGPVFDEWVLVALGDGSGTVQGYEGPRADAFLSSFPNDVAQLRADLSEEELDIGGFCFGSGTDGHAYDAAMRIGPAAYLLVNHTKRSMENIRQRPEWLRAQVAWFGMSERFRADPMLSLSIQRRSQSVQPATTNAA